MRRPIVFLFCLCTLSIHAQVAFESSYQFQNASSGSMLSLSSVSNQANVQVSAYSVTDLTQQWEVSFGPVGTVNVISKAVDQYLNVPSELSGASANSYAFNSNWWSMMWFMEQVTANEYRLRNRWSNLYLTQQTNGDVIQSALNTNNLLQRWNLIPLDECPDSHTWNEGLQPNDSHDLVVGEWAHCHGIVAANAELSIKAGNEIVIYPGFELSQGSEFAAQIGTCQNIEFPLSNTNADLQTQSTYTYLNTFQDDPNQCIILGQNIGWSFETKTETVDQLHRQTGEWVGLIAGQMRYNNGATSPNTDYAALVNTYAAWHTAGGLCELSMLPDNPWTGGDCWDRSGVQNLNQLTTPGQNGYASWIQQLDFYADVLLDMQSAGVPILFRPLMEMNGDFFWYGYMGNGGSENPAPNPQQYINLYRHMHDYFTNVKGLNNLIWIYSANMSYFGIPDVDHYYPGTNYVDLTGLDVYTNDLALPMDQYNKMVALNKPFSFTEFGPTHTAAEMDGSKDYEAYTNNVLSNYPEVIYMNAWHNWPQHDVAWISNQRYTEALNIPCVVSRDELQSN
jgi:mannan endo-1,4-beta-mannosidase